MFYHIPFDGDHFFGPRGVEEFLDPLVPSWRSSDGGERAP